MACQNIQDAPLGSDKAFQGAASQNVETANLYISPSPQSYWKI